VATATAVHDTRQMHSKDDKDAGSASAHVEAPSSRFAPSLFIALLPNLPPTLSSPVVCTAA
jgi:hypothetical protein